MAEKQFDTLLGEMYLQLVKGAARKNIFALRAEKEKRSDMALFFHALAESEEAQARRLLYLLRGLVGKTEENVAEVMEEELPLLQRRYCNLAEQTARQEGMVSVRHLADQEQKVGKKNSFLLKKTWQGNGQAAVYHVCSFCGYVHENEAPETCPVCQAPRKRFRRVG